MRLLTASCAATILAGAALAADPPAVPPPTEEELKIADVLIDFLSPQEWSYGFTWGSVTVRTDSVRWHLADPGDDDRDPVYFRCTGWTEYPGRSLWVTACGDEETLMVATVTGDSSYMGGEEDRVLDPRILAALEAKGATVEEISREPDAATYPIEDDIDDEMAEDIPLGERSATHRISIEGRLPGVLDQVRICTSRMSAAAQSCETRYTLVLDASNLDAAEELRGRCATPGIWW
jgi:hypothetical protein